MFQRVERSEEEKQEILRNLLEKAQAKKERLEREKKTTQPISELENRQNDTGKLLPGDADSEKPEEFRKSERDSEGFHAEISGLNEDGNAEEFKKERKKKERVVGEEVGDENGGIIPEGSAVARKGEL